MRFQRLLVGALGAALLGALPVALASSPAQAGAAPFATKVFLRPQAVKVFAYGNTLKVSGQIGFACEAPEGYCVMPDTTGVVKLFRKMAGASSYKYLKTISDESDFTFSTTSVGNAYYKVAYTGGTYTDGTTTYTFDPSELSRLSKGSRDLNTRGVRSGGKLYLKGNVNPGWAHSYVVFQKKNCGSCSWYKFKSVKTNRYGAYVGRIYAPRSGSDFFRVKIAATAPRFVTGYSAKVYETYQYRARTSTPGAGITAR